MGVLFVGLPVILNAFSDFGCADGVEILLDPNIGVLVAPAELPNIFVEVVVVGFACPNADADVENEPNPDDVVVVGVPNIDGFSVAAAGLFALNEKVELD